MLKKIWNIFEYSISFSHSQEQINKNNNLMLERHLDQLLMCSIYAACKISQMSSVKFQDIMKHYRSTSTNSNHLVYRSVLIAENSRDDLISFYNQIFLNKLKSYLIQLSNKMTTKSTLAQQVCPSPVPRLPANSSHLLVGTQFSPCKISDFNLAVCVSPSKALQPQTQLIQQNSLINTNSTSNPIPTPSQPLPPQRNRIIFSFGDKNPNKSIDAINEMIKKNELKIRTSNKRLFSDISLHNAIPLHHMHQPSIVNVKSIVTSTTTTVSNTVNTVTKTSNETADEADGISTNKIARVTTDLTSTIVNRPLSHSNCINTNTTNKIMTTNTKLGSTPTNLVTMVISSNSNSNNSNSSIPLMGSNFARKLQDIQSEMINFK